MKRIDYIRAMTVEEIAEIIINKNVTDEFCRSYCGEEDDCPHPKWCCMPWLDEHDVNFLVKGWEDR